jgi:hypothetical protein
MDHDDHDHDDLTHARPPGGGEQSNQLLLTQRIIRLSEADTWAEAVLEWGLDRIEVAEAYGDAQCLCTHDIKEMCWIRNRLNGNEALVGNVCISRFMKHIASPELVFEGLARIHADENAAMNSALIRYANRKGWLTSWELEFLTDTRLVRSMSAAQFAKRRQINLKVRDLIAAKRVADRKPMLGQGSGRGARRTMYEPAAASA